MGKIFRGLSILVLLVFIANPSIEAATGKDVVSVTIGSAKAETNGKTVTLSMAPEVKNGFTYISTSDCQRLFPGKFYFDTLFMNGYCRDFLTNTTITYKSGQNLCNIDGDDMPSKASAYFKETASGKYFMIPLKTTFQEFGYAISMDKSKKITLSRSTTLHSANWSRESFDSYGSFSVPNGLAPKKDQLEKRWELQSSNDESFPIFCQGKMLFPVEGVWNCYDLASKKVLWSMADKANAPGMWNIPAVNGGMVFSGNGPTAFDLNTGKVLWQSKLTKGECFAFNDRLIVEEISNIRTDQKLQDCKLTCFDAKTGNLLWSSNFTDQSYQTGIIWYWTKKLVYSSGRLMYYNTCIDQTTGKKLYSINEPKFEDWLGFMSTQSGNFVCWTKNKICIFDGAGILKHSVETGTPVNCAAQNGKIYVVSSDATLSCIDEKTGKVDYSNMIDKTMVGNMAVSGHLIYMWNKERITTFGISTGKTWMMSRIDGFFKQGPKFNMQMAIFEGKYYIIARIFAQTTIVEVIAK